MTNLPADDKEYPVLIVIEGPLRGQQWTMDQEALIIGRGGGSDIVIPERRISREHVRIEYSDDGYFITDLDSKNGTYVNGEQLTSPRELHEGDEIQIALTAKIKFIGSEATVPLTLDDLSTPARGLHLNQHTREVIINGETLEPQLSLFQYRLLELLYIHGGGVCTRDEVVQAVWPEADEEGVSEQAIDALVRRLRDRLSELEPNHQFIVTVRGHGFRLEQPSVE